MARKLIFSTLVLVLLNSQVLACGGGDGGDFINSNFSNSLKKTVDVVAKAGTHIARSKVSTPKSTAAAGASKVVGPVVSLLSSAADAAIVMGPRGVQGFKDFFRYSFSEDAQGVPSNNPNDVPVKGVFSSRNAKATIEYWSN